MDELVSRYPENISSKSTVRDQREWTIKIHNRTNQQLQTREKEIFSLSVLKDTRARRELLQLEKGDNLPQMLLKATFKK